MWISLCTRKSEGSFGFRVWTDSKSVILAHLNAFLGNKKKRKLQYIININWCVENHKADVQWFVHKYNAYFKMKKILPLLYRLILYAINYSIISLFCGPQGKRGTTCNSRYYNYIVLNNFILVYVHWHTPLFPKWKSISLDNLKTSMSIALVFAI